MDLTPFEPLVWSLTAAIGCLVVLVILLIELDDYLDLLASPSSQKATIIKQDQSYDSSASVSASRAVFSVASSGDLKSKLCLKNPNDVMKQSQNAVNSNSCSNSDNNVMESANIDGTTSVTDHNAPFPISVDNTSTSIAPSTSNFSPACDLNSIASNAEPPPSKGVTQEPDIAILTGAGSTEDRINSLTSEQKAAFDVLFNHYHLSNTNSSSPPSSSSSLRIQEVEGLRIDRACLLRYLRARKYIPQDAIQMLDETIAWRKEFLVSKIHNEWKPQIEKENETGKMYVRGFDREGHVLVYMKPKFENTCDHDGNLRHLVFQLEKAIACMLANKDGAVEKLSLLIDYDGFSLLNAPPFKTSMGVLNILQKHYPERLFRGYIMRPPWIFSAFWNTIYPFIDPVTKSKVVMLGFDIDEIRNALEKDIDLEVLEDSLGGYDKRPFNHKLFLEEENFHLDFNAILAKEER